MMEKLRIKRWLFGADTEEIINESKQVSKENFNKPMTMKFSTSMVHIDTLYSMSL